MQSLDPKVLAVFFIKNFLSTVYILPIWFIGIFIFEKTWTANVGAITEDVILLLLEGAGVIFFSLLIMGCYFWSWFTYKNFSYELQQDGFHIMSGIIIKKHVVIPYADIESVDLYVNPLAVRLLDLYGLNIKTRELENTEGIFKKKHTNYIPGLSSDSARFLRTELLKDSQFTSVKKTFRTPVSSSYN